jgi:hypothetical protein
MEETGMKTVTTGLLVLALLAPFPVCGQEIPAPAVSIHTAALQGNIEAIRQHIEAGSLPTE